MELGSSIVVMPIIGIFSHWPERFARVFPSSCLSPLLAAKCEAFIVAPFLAINTDPLLDS